MLTEAGAGSIASVGSGTRAGMGVPVVISVLGQARAPGGAACPVVERPVVAGAAQRAEQGGIEAAAGHPPRLDGPGHDRANEFVAQGRR